jgi:hypothetical protein
MDEVAVCTKCQQEFYISDENDIANISNIDIHGECYECAMKDKE